MVEELKYRTDRNVTNVRLVGFDTIIGIKNECNIHSMCKMCEMAHLISRWHEKFI